MYNVPNSVETKFQEPEFTKHFRRSNSNTTLDDMTLDGDMPLYTEQEVEKLRFQIIKQGLEDATILRMEIQSLESRYNAEYRNNIELHLVLKQYETAVNGFISDTGLSINQNDSVQEQIAQIEMEIMKIANETDRMADHFKQLGESTEGLKGIEGKYKKNEMVLKESLSKAKQHYSLTEGRYAALKKHAEEKLTEASTRLGELINGNSGELQTLRETLQKAETSNVTLQQTYAVKLKEHGESSNLWQDTLGKIEVHLHTNKKLTQEKFKM